ncbi:putative protein kinase RLK-Pelle-WAK family [Helianthus annuus]|nr:putative protein kinase RLK-Pelle-WAK family [Helianthus annuus]
MKNFQLVILLQFFLIGLVNATQNNSQCPEKCGNVTIHYPFGIKEGCYMDKSYYIECDSATLVPRLNQTFSLVIREGLTRFLEVIEIKLDGHLIVNLPIAHACYNKSGGLLYGSEVSYHVLRFPFSSTLNNFVGVGRDVKTGVKLTEPVVTTSCLTNFLKIRNAKNGSCLGFGCCKTGILAPNITYAKVFVKPTKNSKKPRDYKMCGYAFIVDRDKYNFNNGDYSTLSTNKSFPAFLEWSIANITCEEAQKDKVAYMCQDNSVCVNGEDKFLGYRCNCSPGFSGNPYIKGGCQDVNECESQDHNDCLLGHCKNTYGGFYCVCPDGYHGNAKRGGQCTKEKSDIGSVIKGISEGVAGATLTMIFVFWGVKHRRKIEVRKDFFKQNGGIMLQKMLFTSKDTANQATIFTEEELKKATDNFNDANIIGQGGYGTIYKGYLTDKTIVAIKKSKVIDQRQVKQFVNEVIILSKINHPNIVKLLGCCLETHVPLLVYEYVTNNTLCHHIHTNPMLTLEKRLKISEDTAEALSYMHSTLQIIHRDVKPSNILMSDDFTAKVSDFGISTFVPPGKTHLSTFVKGTVGYVDPEYFRTCKLTEKSDVYSFGVVLVELLTRTDIRSLEIPLTIYAGAAAYFASLLEQNALVQVLDDQLKRDEHTEVVKSLAKLAISCLDLEWKTRPTMEEIKQELKELRYLLLSMEADCI